jgi:hypothetical protein
LILYQREWNKDSKASASFRVRTYLSSTPFKIFGFGELGITNFLSMQLVLRLLVFRAMTKFMVDSWMKCRVATERWRFLLL